MDLRVINEIKENCKIKIIVRYCNKVLKKLSVKSSNDLQNITELITWLYVADMHEEAKAVCDILKEVSFEGNYSVWQQVCFIRIIAARILSEQGHEAERTNMLLTINPIVNYTYQDLQDTFEQCDASISTANEMNFKSHARDWKLCKMMALIRYMEMNRIKEEHMVSLMEMLKNDLKQYLK